MGEDFQKELKKYYQVGWEIRWLKNLDESLLPKQLGHRYRLLNSLDMVTVKQGSFKILDLGCGIGLYSFHALKKWPESHIEGVDISSSQIEKCSDLCRLHGIDSRRWGFQVGDVRDFSSSKADIIFCTEVIEHFPEPQPLLDNISRHAHKNTQIILSVPQKLKKDTPEVYYRQIIGDNFENVEVSDRSKLMPGMDVYKMYHKHYSKEEILNLLESRFEIVELRSSFFQFCKIKEGSHAIHKIFDRVINKIHSRSLDKMFSSLSGNNYSEHLLIKCRKK